jgi:hypothetical protein
MSYRASSQNDKANSRGRVTVGGGPEWGNWKGGAEVKGGDAMLDGMAIALAHR